MAEQETGLAGPHLVRYGIAADQKYLIGNLLNSYDQLVINARMVAHMAAGLALFLSQRAMNKPYLIDPETHAFQHDFDYLQSTTTDSEIKLKRSIDKMLTAYGDPVERVVRKQESILPQDFADGVERKDFCRRVLQFQVDEIAKKVQEGENAEYCEFLEEKGIIASSSFAPSLIIAPYFCMDGSTFDEWIAVNTSCAQDSIVISEELNIPLGVEIVISQSVLYDQAQRDRLVREYRALGPRTFLLWIDSFSEHEASAGLLGAFVDVMRELKKAGGRVVNLYGSYFSIMLYHLGILDGVTHGLEYGEERAFVPVGGGIPTAKFYLPGLHVRLRPEDAVRSVRRLGGFESTESFLRNVCNCDRCRRVIAENPEVDFGLYLRTKRVNKRNIPYPETKDNSVTHYMLCKQREFMASATLGEIAKELKDASGMLRRHLGVEKADHCRKWADIALRYDEE